ncbi:K(+) efflux antiporter 1 [Hibiscus syriacus]|uniref:K(+) efflux antiporter 1 n=1 Tax=Hibiscus syriacus TaxID=106335 RepID=A0A6A3ADT0_HIBSY|nr:K(+) efflux antiporter 1 [Hibiscus syriacus]
MDFACSFNRLTIFHAGEGTSYRILDRLCPRSKCRNLGYNFLNLNIGSKAQSLKKMRKVCLHDVSKLRGVRLRCQGNDSIADGNGRNVEFLESSDGSSSNGLGEERNGECIAKEAVRKATMALSLAEARLQVTRDSSGESNVEIDVREDNGTSLAAEYEIRECLEKLANCEAELRQLQHKKEELQKEADRLNRVAEKAQMDALKAEEDVANIMLLAEQAVAFELEATQHGQDLAAETVVEEEISPGGPSDVIAERERDAPVTGDLVVAEPKADILSGKARISSEDLKQYDDLSDHENGILSSDSPKETEIEAEKNLHVSSLRLFSFTDDGTEFTPSSIAQSLSESARKHFPKLIVGVLLLGAGVAFYANQAERRARLMHQPDVITTSVEDVSSNAKPLIQQVQKIPKKLKELVALLPHQEMNEEEASLFDVLWLLLASVIFVPIFQKIPGGSPVLGYLAAGILIGPYGLSIIRHVHGTKAIAEFGVVFLLFNIGLELSVERLSSMKKYVFGLGSAQVLLTAVVVGLVAHFVAGQPGPAAIVIGNGLALSSTAVVLQVLQERGESTSRHGRATFSVLLFQDLAVVVLLILIPLISPNSSKGGIGFRAIAEALDWLLLGSSAIAAIIAGGRLAGLSMALGAFLAGLLLAETEFSLQVESDIAPYRASYWVSSS